MDAARTLRGERSWFFASFQGLFGNSLPFLRYFGEPCFGNR
jgi:hypothetical protein